MATYSKGSFEDKPFTKPIKPGLFHLPININFQPDFETLNERRKVLEIHQKEEHAVCQLIIQNLIAMTYYRTSRCRKEVGEILEGIKDKHPNHLNTLAFLEIYYKDLHRHTDSDRCKEIQETVLRSELPSDMELKAQCILEQGYALIDDEATNHEGIANKRLGDSIKILENVYERSQGIRGESIRQALRLAKQASSCVLNSMFCNRSDQGMQRKENGIEYLSDGLKLLETVDKIRDIDYHIWNFSLGRAYSRLENSIYEQEDTDKNDQAKSQAYGKALQIFWDIISNMPRSQDTTLYRGRSYAYIGYLAISRRDNLLKNASVFGCFHNDQGFMHLIENPMQCFKDAESIRPDDVHVLNRKGASIKNWAERSTDEQFKYDRLQHAYDVLTKSISILPDSNWFGFLTRMTTSKDLAILEKRDDEKKLWLEKAREDGIHFLKSKASEPNLCMFAKVCQMLAKCPDVERHGSKYVKNKDYIHEAIQYLNYALQLGGFVSWKVVYTLGQCLYDIGEYRTAVEWMKRAMHVSKSSRKLECLTRIGEYLLDFYSSEVTKKGKPTYLFEELKFCISEGESRYLDDKNPSIINLCKFRRDGMMDFVNHLKANSDAYSRQLAELCLKNLQKYTQDPRKAKIISNLQEEFHRLPLPNSYNETDLPRESQFVKPDIVMPFSADAIVHDITYKYDFFVSHSKVNGDWVKGVLLHQLETKLHEGDTAFKGCIADRDFTPGKTIIANILDALAYSHKIILVITKAFLDSRWCDYEVDQAVMQMLQKKKEECIIPVLLEDVKIPEQINHITALNLTDKSKHPQEIMKLKFALNTEI